MSDILLFLSPLALALLVAERLLVLCARKRLSHVVHVNGTRGKSGVTRLIAAGLRAGGLQVFSKTTGTLPTYTDVYGKEHPIRRFGPASIREQRDMLLRAAVQGAEVLVIECMALAPELQRASARDILAADITVFTNVRLDHTDVMGETLEEIGASLLSSLPKGKRRPTLTPPPASSPQSPAAFTNLDPASSRPSIAESASPHTPAAPANPPFSSHPPAAFSPAPISSSHSPTAFTPGPVFLSQCPAVFTPDAAFFPQLSAAAATRGIAAVFADPADIDESFDFPGNIAVALAVCEALGVDRETALSGMRAAAPDPYALRVYRLGQTAFINGLSANDPESALLCYQKAVAEHSLSGDLALVINNRADRPQRAVQMLELCRALAPRRVIFLGALQGYSRRKLRRLLPECEILCLKRAADVPLTGYPILFATGNLMGEGLALFERVERASEVDL